jgi:hypothetical protein
MLSRTQSIPIVQFTPTDIRGFEIDNISASFGKATLLKVTISTERRGGKRDAEREGQFYKRVSGLFCAGAFDVSRDHASWYYTKVAE